MMKLLISILILGQFSWTAFAQSTARPMSADFYERLGVSRTDSTETIKKAYRRLAMKYHPDRNPELDRTLLQNINEAWATLQDDAKRAEYNQGRSSSAQRAQPQARPQPQAQPRPQPQPKPSATPTPAKDRFLIVGEDLIEKLNRGEDIRRQKALLDQLFAKPESVKYPQLVEMLMSRHMDFVVDKVLIQPHWKRSPDFSLWFSRAVQNGSYAVSKALMEGFFESIPSEQGKKVLILKILNQQNDVSLQVLADKIPLSSGGPDYTAEIRELLQKGDSAVRQRLATRFHVFLSSRLTVLPPNTYYEIAAELNPAPEARPAETAHAYSNEPANKDYSYAGQEPEGWKRHRLVWNSRETYLENLARSILYSQDFNREYLLNLAREIDWKTPNSPGAKAFVNHSLRFMYNYHNPSLPLTTEAQTPAAVRQLMSLPMTVHYPELLIQLRISSTDTTKTDLIVLAVREMSRSPHWLTSPELNRWIEKLAQLNIESVNYALEKILAPELGEVERIEAMDIVRAKGKIRTCEGLF